MMNAKNSCFDPESLGRLLDDEAEPDEEHAIQDHLETCIACRRRLSELAAGDLSWEDASAFFVDDELDSEVRVTTPTTDDSHGDCTANVSIDAVLERLAPTDDPQMLGRFGGYEIIGAIGYGAMGVVLKGYDQSLKRVVAIKVMAIHLAGSGAARKRFEREAQAAAAIAHDNVIEIYGVAEENGLPYLVMPYSRGTSLQKRIDERGPLPVVEVLRIGSQIASGLAAAHTQGLVHRDIKPANILLSNGVERLVITDFGLARAVDDASMTRTGVIAGTPQYMSPEQARGDSVDHRSDLFSLGSVMYTLCTGRPPFRAESAYGILRRITDNDPRPIREINPEIPDWLCRVIAKLMSKSREDRFESTSEVAELIENCLAHLQQPTATPLPESLAAMVNDGKGIRCGRAKSLRSVIPDGLRSAANRLRPPIRKFIVVPAFTFSFIFAGVLIVLELNKGTLTIESEVDGVPIRIMQGDQIVRELTVSRDGNATRISAGKYTVEIDRTFDKAVVKDGVVTISRGGTVFVKLMQSESKGKEPWQREFGIISDTRSPFTDVQFDGERVIVTLNSQKYEWLEIDGLKVDMLVQTAKTHLGKFWQKRLAEDLVEVLLKLHNHQPGDTVKLSLREFDTDQVVDVQQAPMTEANRWQIYRKYRDVETRDSTESSHPTGEADHSDQHAYQTEPPGSSARKSKEDRQITPEPLRVSTSDLEWIDSVRPSPLEIYARTLRLEDDAKSSFALGAGTRTNEPKNKPHQ